MENPLIHSTPTDGLLELVYAGRENYTNSPEFKSQDADLMKKAFLSFCKQGMLGYCEALTDRPYVLNKSRGWGIYYPFLSQIFPEPKVIVMIRDLRDVFANMEELFRKNSHKSTALVNHAAMTGTSTEKRIDVHANSAPIGLAIERLGEIIRQGYDNKLLFIKFEDLCLHPEKQMELIYHYLGLPYFEHDFDNIQQYTVEDDNEFGIAGLHTIRPKLEMRPSRAKAILGDHGYNWIYDHFRWFFDKFNYKR